MPSLMNMDVAFHYHVYRSMVEDKSQARIT